MDPAIFEAAGGLTSYLDQYDCIEDENASLARLRGSADYKSIRGQFVPCLERYGPKECEVDVFKYDMHMREIDFALLFVENKVIISDLERPIQKRLHKTVIRVEDQKQF